MKPQQGQEQKERRGRQDILVCFRIDSPTNQQIAKLRRKEQRTKSGMIRILLREAIQAREGLNN